MQRVSLLSASRDSAPPQPSAYHNSHPQARGEGAAYASVVYEGWFFVRRFKQSLHRRVSVCKERIGPGGTKKEQNVRNSPMGAVDMVPCGTQLQPMFQAGRLKG